MAMENLTGGTGTGWAVGRCSPDRCNVLPIVPWSKDTEHHYSKIQCQGILPRYSARYLYYTVVKIPSTTAHPDTVTACVRRSPGGHVNTATKSNQWLPIRATDSDAVYGCDFPTPSLSVSMLNDQWHLV